jgi:hypothetical protein
LCEPLITRRQPFSGVAASTAIHTVQVASGRIGQYSPSWCQGVRLPLPAGLAKKLEFHSAKSGPSTCSTMSRIAGWRAKFKKPVSYCRRHEQ